MTLMMGEWPAVNCNDVVASIFDAGKPLAYMYQFLNNTGNPFHYKFNNIEILNKNVTAYVIK